jgi:hypothetical protein
MQQLQETIKKLEYKIREARQAYPPRYWTPRNLNAVILNCLKETPPTSTGYCPTFNARFKLQPRSHAFNRHKVLVTCDRIAEVVP